MPSPLDEFLASQKKVDSEHGETDDANYILCFNFNDQDYFCPISEVHEVLDMTFVSPYPSVVQGQLGVTNVRGKIIPILTDKKFDYSFINRINAGEFNLSHRMMVFDSKDRGHFAIIVFKVSKQLVRSELKFGSALNNQEKPYRLFELENFIDRAIAGAK